MEVSAETRWFWQGTGPAGLKEWFTGAPFHGCIAGGGGHRIDAYLADPQQAELGIKLRGNKAGVEVKGLVAKLSAGCTDSPFVGDVEIWTKWPSNALSLADVELIQVDKQRWLRKFECIGSDLREIALDLEELPIDGGARPDEGCNVEYTVISFGSNLSWITLGFEAFGKLETVAACLRRTTARLALRQCPTLVGGWSASYPRWLQCIVSQ